MDRPPLLNAAPPLLRVLPRCLSPFSLSTAAPRPTDGCFLSMKHMRTRVCHSPAVHIDARRNEADAWDGITEDALTSSAWTPSGDAPRSPSRLWLRVRESRVMRGITHRLTAAGMQIQSALARLDASDDESLASSPSSCPVCLEPYSENGTGTVVRVALTNCGHAACRACLRQYVAARIRDGDGFPTCFHVHTHTHAHSHTQVPDADDAAVAAAASFPRPVRHTVCKAVISDADVRALLREEASALLAASPHSGDAMGDADAPAAAAPTPQPQITMSDGSNPVSEALSQYERLRARVLEPNERDCPNCGAITVGTPRDPAIVCGECGTRYCFFHANAHRSSESCSEYERKASVAWAADRAWMRTVCKACPRCGVHIEKTEGCNAIRCSRCGTGFCWLCCSVLDDAAGTDHFAWWNVAGCPQKMTTGATPGPFSDTLWRNAFYAVCLTALLPFMLAAGIVSLTLYCGSSVWSTAAARFGWRQSPSEGHVSTPTHLTSPRRRARQVLADVRRRVTQLSDRVHAHMDTPRGAVRRASTSSDDDLFLPPTLQSELSSELLSAPVPLRDSLALATSTRPRPQEREATRTAVGADALPASAVLFLCFIGIPVLLCVVPIYVLLWWHVPRGFASTVTVPESRGIRKPQ